MADRSFVDSVLETWLDLQSELPAGVVASDVKRLADKSKAAISIETRGHLAMVEVWESPACLDTTLLPKGAAQGTILSAGPCEGKAEAHKRLDELRSKLMHGH